MIPLQEKKQNETLNAYASVLRVPHEISGPLVQHFQNCIKNHGSEWTISRFKMVKLDFINLKAGKPMESTWIAKVDENHFANCFGGLQSWSEKYWKNWSDAIQLLQIYSTLISSEVTTKQAEKFVDAVTYKNENLEVNLCKYREILDVSIKQWFPRKSIYSDPEPLLTRPISSTRREPHANGKSYPEGENTLECALSFIDQTFCGNFLGQKYPNLFKPMLVDINSTAAYIRTYYASSVGKIGLIQEPGFKLRAVANPARVYQQALKPLGDDLYHKLAMLPWDCTFDQQRPFSILQNHLNNGNFCHAVDLSNATDRFPLALQETVLKRLYLREDGVNLFLDLSRSKWQCSIVPEKVISWSTGQPLGLYPSFALFAFTHGMILYALNNYQHNDCFFVLGDDVVILDDALFAKYITFLADMDIPYSPSKTISSNSLTEFGGKIIMCEGIVPQLKWSRVSDDSFIDLAKNFGERFRRLMLPRQKVIFDLVKCIPDFLGGCGFNPTGIPLAERYEIYLNMKSDDNRQSYLMSYNGRLQSMNYSIGASPLENHWFYTKSPMEAFDQNAACFATNMTPNFTSYIPIRGELWKNVVGNPLYTVYPLKRDIPIAGTSVRTTTLDVLERKFASNAFLIPLTAVHDISEESEK